MERWLEYKSTRAEAKFGPFYGTARLHFSVAL